MSVRPLRAVFDRAKTSLLLSDVVHLLITRLHLLQLELFMLEHVVEIGELLAKSSLANQMLLLVDGRQLGVVVFAVSLFRF